MTREYFSYYGAKDCNIFDYYFTSQKEKDLVNALEIVEIKNPFDSNKTKKVFNIPMYSPSMHEKMDAVFAASILLL